MIDKLGDWQVVERRTHDRKSVVMAVLTRLFFQVPDSEGMTASPVTWTVRNVQTGEIRKITAASEKEFADRLAAHVFD